MVWTANPDRASTVVRPHRGRPPFFPFGGGPRHCIGKHLELLEAKLILATVASEYRLAFRGAAPLELLPSLTAQPRQEMTTERQPR